MQGGWHWRLLGKGAVYLIDPDRNAHCGGGLGDLMGMARGGTAQSDAMADVTTDTSSSG